MDCPRCERMLSRYALSGSEASAVICDSCGFVGVSASHRAEQVQSESWESVIERVEDDLDVSETGRHTRVQSPTLPDSQPDTGTSLDSERLDGTVSVGVALTDQRPEGRHDSGVHTRDVGDPAGGPDGPASNESTRPTTDSTEDTGAETDADDKQTGGKDDTTGQPDSPS